MQLYTAKVPIGYGSGENFTDPAPDPTKKVRIRIRNPGYSAVTVRFTPSHLQGSNKNRIIIRPGAINKPVKNKGFRYEIKTEKQDPLGTQRIGT